MAKQRKNRTFSTALYLLAIPAVFSYIIRPFILAGASAFSICVIAILLSTIAEKIAVKLGKLPPSSFRSIFGQKSI
jgi:hypothetical protein